MDTPLKFFGGKHYLASWIISKMPPHLHYVEPYAGGLSVLLAKNPEGCSEVVNDKNLELTNFWQVLRDRYLFDEFARLCAFTPFSEIEWQLSKSVTTDEPVKRAHQFFIRCRQSMAGRMTHWSPLSKNRLRGGMCEQVSAWLSAVEGLTPVHQRLIRVAIYGEDALEVIRREDSVNTLFYCDPPYLPETRTSPIVYANEMWPADHLALLKTVKNCHGKVLISGYDSAMYAEHLRGWHKFECKIPNHSASGESKREMTEILWGKF